MTPATVIQNYLLMHLHRDFDGLDVWRANVVGRRPGVSIVAAGEPGQADLTGVWGGRCRECGLDLRPDSDGSPCCTLPIPGGRSVWIEVKAPRDSQSQSQKDFERRVTRLGALYIICRIRRRETINEILEASAMYRKTGTAAHPPEIVAFFNDLRSKL